MLWVRWGDDVWPVSGRTWLRRLGRARRGVAPGCVVSGSRWPLAGRGVLVPRKRLDWPQVHPPFPGPPCWCVWVCYRGGLGWDIGLTPFYRLSSFLLLLRAARRACQARRSGLGCPRHPAIVSGVRGDLLGVNVTDAWPVGSYLLFCDLFTGSIGRGTVLPGVWRWLDGTLFSLVLSSASWWFFSIPFIPHFVRWLGGGDRG